MTNEEIKILITAESDKATKEITKLSKELSKFEKSSKKTNKQLNTMTKSFNSVGSSLKAVALGFASFQGVKSVIDQMVELESGMIGVAKTTGLAGEDLEDLSDRLDNLSKEIKGVDILELQNIAETAGQLGITGAKDITTFTKAVSKISIATELTAQQAAQDFATIGTLLHEPIANTEKLGSVINQLSNTTNASTSDILEFTKRIASSGKQLGLTTSDVLGLSATLKSLGTSAEAGGSSMSRIFGLMTADVEGFARASGVSMSSFKQTLEDEPIAALQLFLEEFDKLDKYAQEDVLKELGLGGVETKRVIQSLASNTKVLTKNLKESSQEWKNNTSLQNEYETASRSLDSTFKELNNRWLIAVKTLGEKLAPKIKEVTERAIEMMDKLDAETINGFADGISSLVDGIMGLGKVLSHLNDIAMPDILGGKDSGLVGTVLSKSLEGWKKMGEWAEYIFANKLPKATKKTTEAIAETTKETENLTQKAEELVEATKSNADASDELTEAQKKEAEGKKILSAEDMKLVKTIKDNLKERVSATENTINTLFDKEKKYTQSVKDLQKELKDFNADYETEREVSNINHEKKIADIRADGLSDYRKYKDAQKRAEEAGLAGDKALAEGKLKLAEEYYKVQGQLIEVSANKEIEENGRTLISKRRSNEEYLKDVEDNYQKLSNLSEANHKKEVAQKEAEIAKEEAMLKLTIKSMEIQISYMEMLGQAIVSAGGAATNFDLSKLKSEFEEVKVAANEAIEKERNLNVSTTDAVKDVKDVEKKIDDATIETELELDTKPAFTGYKVIYDKVTGEPIDAEMFLDTKEADLTFEKTKKAYYDTEMKSELLIDVDNTEPTRAIEKNKQNTSSIHTIYIKRVELPLATGGIVQPLATGGAAGYTRRRGKIAGHDLSGSDDVPAMLTRGEYVTNTRAVDHYGQSFFEALNKRLIPKNVLGLADGGSVTSTTSTPTGRPINLTIKDQSFSMMADDEVASALERLIRKEM